MTTVVICSTDILCFLYSYENDPLSFRLAVLLHAIHFWSQTYICQCHTKKQAYILHLCRAMNNRLYMYSTKHKFILLIKGLCIHFFTGDRFIIKSNIHHNYRPMYLAKHYLNKVALFHQLSSAVKHENGYFPH